MSIFVIVLVEVVVLACKLCCFSLSWMFFLFSRILINLYISIYLSILNISYASEAICFLVMAATVIAIVLLIVGTIPEVKHQPDTCSLPACDNDAVLCPGRIFCEPIQPAWFLYIEDTCQFIFVIDYFTRNLLCSFVPTRLANVLPTNVDVPHVGNENGDIEVLIDPIEIKAYFDLQIKKGDDRYSNAYQQLKYSMSLMSLVDLLAIIPFFLELNGTKTIRLEVVRVIRLARLLRLMKLTKVGESSNVLTKTMAESFSALVILFFFAVIGVVFFGSVLFFFEQGHFVVNSDYPHGKYIR